MQTILTVNGGSSSLKCALYRVNGEQLEALYSFKLGNILNQPSIRIFDNKGSLLENVSPDYSAIGQDDRHQACLQWVIDWMQSALPESQLTAIGHRVVHGGGQFSAPIIIDQSSLNQLKEFIPLAPLHQPYNLKLIEACQALAPDLPQIACFDTMFHSTQSKLETHYAIPREYTAAGVRRYGFHGLSYEYIQRQLEQDNRGTLNTVVCHLGAGASMCAIKQGKSIASSMGFTAVDGLPMGSRCGNLDPGVLLYLQRHYQMDTDALERLIYKQSGWLGVSDVSSDMLELHQSSAPEAEEAIEMFCYRVSLELGRLSAALAGLEQIVFTGGVGENDADVRQRICQRSEWLGVNLQQIPPKHGIISDDDSKVMVQVIPTDEEAMIATHVMEVIN